MKSPAPATILFLMFSGFAFMLTLIAGPGKKAKLEANPDVKEIPETAEVATFAAGCFWCVEEPFQQMPGVLSAVSGYMGGDAGTANYNSVSTGRTEHAEVVQVHFDPTKVSYEELLDKFFTLHDPTQLNRQGPDRGTQYRSAIFYHDESQQNAAEEKIRKLTEAKKFEDPIVTEVVQAMPFFVAEEYHQNYARLNPNDYYLRNFLHPKLKKMGLKIPGTSNGGPTVLSEKPDQKENK